MRKSLNGLWLALAVVACAGAGTWLHGRASATEVTSGRVAWTIYTGMHGFIGDYAYRYCGSVDIQDHSARYRSTGGHSWLGGSTVPVALVDPPTTFELSRDGHSNHSTLPCDTALLRQAFRLANELPPRYQSGVQCSDHLSESYTCVVSTTVAGRTKIIRWTGMPSFDHRELLACIADEICAQEAEPPFTRSLVETFSYGQHAVATFGLSDYKAHLAR